MPNPSTGLPRKPTPLYVWLGLAAIVASPLQQAFTVDIGSPLKLSEIFGVLAIVALMFTSRRAPRPQELPLILVLVGLVLASAAYHLVLGAPNGMYLGYTRSPEADLVFYTIYPIIIILLWRVWSSIDSHKTRTALKLAVWVCLGGIALQIVLQEMGRVDLLESLGYEMKVGSEALVASGGEGTRNGTFTEGQHLGFFAGFAALTMIRSRSYVTAFGAALALIYSQSTTGVLGLVAAMAIVAVIRPTAPVILRTLSLALAGVAIFATVPSIRSFIEFQLEKLGLFSGVSQIGWATMSLEVRQLKTEIAWNMLLEHPWLGVGPGRFGYWYFLDPLSAQSPKYYFNGDARAIAENIYLQIGAEFGVVALVVFVCFLLKILRGLWKRQVWDLGIFAFVVIAIGTQSSWTFIPAWIALAYLVASQREKPGGEPGPLSSLRPASPDTIAR